MQNKIFRNNSSECKKGPPYNVSAAKKRRHETQFLFFRRGCPGMLLAQLNKDKITEGISFDVYESTAPVIDLYDEKDQIVVKAELPGMAKDAIEIDISDHQLTLKGEKKKEEEIKEENYYRSERSY
jgi:HSP20 family molecular chaperone IbpA